MHHDGLCADDTRTTARSRRRRMISALLTGAVAAAVVLPSSASAATPSATTSSLAAVFSGAQAGDTILLAAGDYGTFSGAMKSGEVTLKAAPGAAVSMALAFNPAANITIDGVTLTKVDIGNSATKNITVRNSDIPGQTTLRTGQLQNANILFDHNVHRDFNACGGCGPEGRIWLPENTSQPSGITIQNSEFRGGMSDGIQNGSNATRILNNTFHDLAAGSADGVHTDAIQLYGSENTLIKGNYFYNVPDAIMAPDGANHEIIEDNVVAADPGGYPFAITLYSDDSSTLRHNTFADGACSFNLRCGIVRIGSKNSCSYATECDPGHGTTIKDNILGELSLGGGNATTTENTSNLYTSTPSGNARLRAKPVFVGGVKPSSWAGYALAAGSPGKGSASDGLDRGIRVGGQAATTPPAGSSVRVLSSLRSIRTTGRLRVRILTAASGAVVVSGDVLPGEALAKYRKGHSRKIIKLRAVSLGQLAAGARTVTFKLARKPRRGLGRSKSARLTVTVAVGGRATSANLSIKR